MKGPFRARWDTAQEIKSNIPGRPPFSLQIVGRWLYHARAKNNYRPRRFERIDCLDQPTGQLDADCPFEPAGHVSRGGHIASLSVEGLWADRVFRPGFKCLQAGAGDENRGRRVPMVRWGEGGNETASRHLPRIRRRALCLGLGCCSGDGGRAMPCPHTLHSSAVNVTNVSYFGSGMAR